MAFVKHDSNKNRLDLVDPDFIWELGQVLTYGARKYDPTNWQKAAPEEAKQRYTAAALRHLNRWQAGEDVDPESGLPHLAHLSACIQFLRWFERQVKEADVEPPVLDSTCTCRSKYCPSCPSKYLDLR
jgi:Domain of unknown function (DUF5664)